VFVAPTNGTLLQDCKGMVEEVDVLRTVLQPSDCLDVFALACPAQFCVLVLSCDQKVVGLSCVLLPHPSLAALPAYVLLQFGLIRGTLVASAGVWVAAIVVALAYCNEFFPSTK
jgi:hypothetical protein